jgi:hypothetical protein
MTTSDIDRLEGNRMPDADVDQFLTETGVGVLSLARDGEAYGIPVSFGYDADAGRIYFVFVGFGEESQKEEFAAATTRASLLAYEVEGTDKWRSVVVDGPLAEVDDDEWQHASETIGENAWYPSLFREADPMRGLRVFALDVDSKSGLHSGQA